MTISSFVSDILDKLILEVKKKENINKLEKNLIDPLIHYTFNKLYPYLALISIIFILIFIFSSITLFLHVRNFTN